jgi:pimeloyl-ACP methyl ester carboxylesterase
MDCRARLVLAACALACGVVVGACSTAPTPTVPPVPVATPFPSGPATPKPTAASAPTAAPAPTPAASPIASGWRYVGTKPCPDESAFECVTLAVPRDHFAAAGPTWDVTFALKRATGKRLGTFVDITGGPGTSGIAVADSYTDAWPATIPERFDVVFIDQRGVGLSRPIQCPEATGIYFSSPERPEDPAQADAAGAVARTYVADCLAESRVDPADLPYYATRQAVEDLEAIREYLKADTLQLYGESYGTQYVQTYAASHPDRIATLYLDGPVDLTVDVANFYGEAVRSFDNVLVASLNACALEAVCAADFGAAVPLAGYDALAARLAAAPVPYAFPMGDGTTQRRSLTISDLENAAVSYLYSPGERVLLERALAAAAGGNLVPLARIAYASIAIDPDTLKVVPDPTWSDAMYYAVECQDYVYNPGVMTEAERLASYLAQARALGVNEARLGATYYGDMPCLYWPNRPAADPRPAPIVAAPYKTIVMVATADPITPVANAVRIANRLTNVHTIIQTGGPHIIFGWGESCPDDVIATYLTKGTLPAGSLTVCDGSVTDTYVPLARRTAAAYVDALQFANSFADQVLNTNDYWYGLGSDPLAMGCDFGGVLRYRPTDTGTDLELRACEFTAGMPVSGSGRIDDSTGGMTLDMTFPDGSLRYTSDGEGRTSVNGTFRGKPVDTSH